MLIEKSVIVSSEKRVRASELVRAKPFGGGGLVKRRRSQVCSARRLQST